MIKFLDLHSQYLSIKPEIDTAIQDVIEKSAYIGGGYVRTFEEQFAHFQDAGYCIGVGNGTDALEIALEALALEAGSEILVPANTFIATSEAVTRSGHKVVFVDCDPDSYTISIEDLERKITKNTSAIMAVHLYGHPCAMDALKLIAQKNKLKIIEDSAQAHGALYKGTKVGAIGDIGTFSFYPGKNLGAYGDGGAIITNDKELANRCRVIANHGRQTKYEHDIEGRNSRLDGMQAAILSVKLKHLDRWLSQRNTIASIYKAELAEVEHLKLPVSDGDIYHAYHLFVISTSKRNELKAFLEEKEVQTGIHYPISLPNQPAYKYLGDPDETMHANQSAESLLSLPIGEHLSAENALAVCKLVKEFFKNLD